MAVYEQLPGRLDLALRGGDRLSTEIDFNPISLSGYTMVATLSSVAAGQTVTSITTTLNDAAAGKVTISLTNEQTAALARGTYRWDLTGTDSGGTRRSYLTGFVEVVG
jgi:hypothetical protein